MKAITAEPAEYVDLLVADEPGLRLLCETASIPERVLRAAIERCGQQTPKIGQIALEKRQLNMRQIFAVLDAQADSDERFGEIAIRLGFMTAATLNDLLAEQRRQRPGLAEMLLAMGAIGPEHLSQVQKALGKRARVRGTETRALVRRTRGAKRASRKKPAPPALSGSRRVQARSGK